MSYQLNAAIGPFDVLRKVVPDEVRSSVVPLRQRMGLVPLRPALFARSGGAFPEAELSAWSHAATIGQVEADFFGGDGEQTASLWRDGRRIWGPSYAEDFDGPRHEWPINAVLARLGVVLEPGEVRQEYHDLFVEVGLGAERDREGWSRRAVEARQYATYDEWDAACEVAARAAAREAAERDTYTRLPGVVVPLDGGEVMRILGLPPGRQVGAALRFLQNLLVERGELSREAAIAALRSWDTRPPRAAGDE
ncbi:hypothetical protein ACIA8K_39955 [Catenuloplanes sp. NPDC051500]|uniref:hypothetical protein n=1 Tax=Catenuloplanes sp. NPDC051500 TaxID=3363959 RepID=UPI003787F7B8